MSALLSFGSTLVAIGAPPGAAGWEVEIQDPFDPKKTLGSVRLKDEALSTSGSYEKFIEIGGRRRSHLMNPKTGRPAEGVASATVIAPTGTESEALTKPLVILGASEGVALVEKRGRAAFVVPDRPEAPRVSTPGWKSRFTEVR